MRYFIAVLLSLTAWTLSAQKIKDKKALQSTKVAPLRGPEVRFKNKIHDFGRINIDIQYARTSFVFYNIGDKPLRITNCVASCGCTTPDWSRDSVMPGDSGFVDVRYETINHPGTFRKTITVYTNSDSTPFVHLDILGDVYRETVQATNQAPDYGRVYFSIPTIEFKPLYDNGPDTMQVRLINGSLFSTEFQPIPNIPPYCKIIGYPRSLEPNENALISVILDGKMMKSYGFGAFELPVNSSSPVNPNIGLYVAYTRMQYFPKMNAKQLAKAPKLKLNIEGEKINFGGHSSGDVLDTTLLFTNTGKTELIIHEIYPECSCIRVNFPKSKLMPGESMKVHFSFDTVMKDGATTQSVWIVCNDPTKPERFLYLSTNLPKHVQKCLTCPDR